MSCHCGEMKKISGGRTLGQQKPGSEHRPHIQCCSQRTGSRPFQAQREPRALSIHCPSSPSHRDHCRTPRGTSRRSAMHQLHQLISLGTSKSLSQTVPAPQNLEHSKEGGSGVWCSQHLLSTSLTSPGSATIHSSLETCPQHRKEICPLFKISLQKNACLIYPENLTSVTRWILSKKNLVC